MERRVAGEARVAQEKEVFTKTRTTGGGGKEAGRRGGGG